MSDHNKVITSFERIMWWDKVYKEAIKKGCHQRHQPPGEWCRTSSDKRASYLHKERTRADAKKMRDTYPR